MCARNATARHRCGPEIAVRCPVRNPRVYASPLSQSKRPSASHKSTSRSIICGSVTGYGSSPVGEEKMLSITSSTSIYLALRLVHECARHAHIPTQYLHHTPRTLPRWLWSLSAIAPAQPVAAQPLPSQQTVVHERLSGSAHATRSTLVPGAAQEELGRRRRGLRPVRWQGFETDHRAKKLEI